MSEVGMGQCKHGTFVLSEGCPKCITESINARRVEEGGGTNIVKVRYLNGNGEPGGREYSYFSEDTLAIGDFVKVPVSRKNNDGFPEETIAKAQITTVNVPEDEIAAFRDKVKTIPSDSIQEKRLQRGIETDWEHDEDRAEAYKLLYQAESNMTHAESSHTADNAEESWKREQAAIQRDNPPDITESKSPVDDEIIPIPPALATIERQLGKSVSGLFELYQEAASLLQYAKNRIISTNEDLKHTTDELSIIATCKKKMTERKKEILAPFKAQVDSINQAFGDLMFPVEEADRINRGKVLEFRRIEQEKMALARREAASKAGETTIELQDKVPDHTYTGLGTQSFQKVHRWEVTDKSQIPLDYMMPDAAKISAVVKSSKGTVSIPGIRIFTDETVRVNPRKG